MQSLEIELFTFRSRVRFSLRTRVKKTCRRSAESPAGFPRMLRFPPIGKVDRLYVFAVLLDGWMYIILTQSYNLYAS
jgi:hypothetical protein